MLIQNWEQIDKVPEARWSRGGSETHAICTPRQGEEAAIKVLSHEISLSCATINALSSCRRPERLSLNYVGSHCIPGRPPSDRNCRRRERRGLMSGFTRQMRGGERADLRREWGQLLLWDPFVCALDRPDLTRPGPAVTAEGCVVASATGMFVGAMAL